MQAACAHLDQIAVPRPDGVAGCEDCMRTGDAWVHLRVCLSCGHVACCDSSPNRHASAHWRASSHPLVQSVEPGESWCWFYEDEVVLQRPDGA